MQLRDLKPGQKFRRHGKIWTKTGETIDRLGEIWIVISGQQLDTMLAGIEIDPVGLFEMDGVVVERREWRPE
jgi:hypothetical protein